MRVLKRATISRQTSVLYWDSDQWLTIRQRIPDWGPTAADGLEFAAKVVDERVPAEACQTLAGALGQRLNE